MFSKDQGSGGFQCTVCSLNSGSMPPAVKSHYVKDHGVSITISSKTLVLKSQHAVSPSVQSLQAVEECSHQRCNHKRVNEWSLSKGET